jgi:hypothetical protein
VFSEGIYGVSLDILTTVNVKVPSRGVSHHCSLVIVYERCLRWFWKLMYGRRYEEFPSIDSIMSILQCCTAFTAGSRQHDRWTLQDLLQRFGHSAWTVFMMLFHPCEIWTSHNSNAESSYVLGCDTVLLGECDWCVTFWRHHDSGMLGSTHSMTHHHIPKFLNPCLYILF